jgi:hypothetical protein
VRVAQRHGVGRMAEQLTYRVEIDADHDQPRGEMMTLIVPPEPADLGVGEHAQPPLAHVVEPTAVAAGEYQTLEVGRLIAPSFEDGPCLVIERDMPGRAAFGGGVPATVRIARSRSTCRQVRPNSSPRRSPVLMLSSTSGLR